MSHQKRSITALIVLICTGLLLTALAASAAAQSTDVAPRPTRTARPTRTPIPTATPVATATATPTATPGGGTGVWTLVDSPNVAGRSNMLAGLVAVAPDDIWAVGEHRTSNGSSTQTLTLHWNGSTWSVVPSPNPDPGRNRLLAVAAVAADDVWAVGVKAGVTGPNWASLILHWDGKVWSETPAPGVGSPGTSELRGVAAVSANDVWAVGTYSTPDTGWWDRPLILHWDGATWSNVPAPAFGTTSQLNAVAALGADNVWAVGTALEGNWKTLILHWDGAAWTRAPSPNLGATGNTLAAVAAHPSGDVWAVGAANNGNSTLTLRWNGSTWTLAPSPNGTLYPSTNRNVLRGVAIVSPADVWATGEQAYSTVGGAGQPIYIGYTLILRWNGSAWTEVPAATLPTGGEDGVLAAVAASASGQVWSAGAYFQPDLSVQALRTLIQRYQAP